MNIYTMGFTQKSAEQFFELIKKNNIELLVDIRLNNKSQLAGFTRGNDLKYFLSEICQCKYKYCIEYAPTKDILDRYKKNEITWDKYVEQYNNLMNTRGDYKNFVVDFNSYNNVCLLCSEPTAEQCHRRLIAELITQGNPEINIIHI